MINVRFLLFVVLVPFQILRAHQYYVAADARADGDGSRLHPWRLATMFQRAAAVRPGDTVWVHGGTYRGQFVSRLTGTASKPVILRSYPGERAILDGGNLFGSILTVQGSFAWYWGLEIMSSDSARFSRETGSFPQDLSRGTCVTIDQQYNVLGCKFVNLVLHDGLLGFSAWAPAEDIEVYGCVMYNNGWLAPDRPHGHNVYAQNESMTKRFAENILTHAFSHNIHIYGSAKAVIDNFDFEGNIVFQAGERNVLIGGGRTARNPVFKNNFLYEPDGGTVFNLGYNEFGRGVENAIVTGNYIMGGALKFKDVMNSKIEDNIIYTESLDGVFPDRYPKNSWLRKRPGGVQAFVRANYYEPGRANIVVYNWDGRKSVEADVSSILRNGDNYTLLDAENYFGPAVVQGTYRGGSLAIPMVERQAATPIGLATPPMHAPVEFGAFVLVRKF